jgi:hypothetical protein
MAGNQRLTTKEHTMKKNVSIKTGMKAGDGGGMLGGGG